MLEIPSTQLVANNLKAWITVDGKPLQVFAAEKSENEARCFVESWDGAEFKVHLDFETFDPMVSPYLVSFLHLDGKRTDGYVVTVPDTVVHEDRSEGLNGRRFFEFTPIKLTHSNAEACKDQQLLDNLGIVKLEVYRAKGQKVLPDHHPTYPADKEIKIYHESPQAKLSHTTGLKKLASGPNHRWNEPFGRDDDPYQTFSFRYRSKEILQSSGLMPGSWSPISFYEFDSDTDSSGWSSSSSSNMRTGSISSGTARRYEEDLAALRDRVKKLELKVTTGKK